ncbi:serine/threonine-protein kinase [Corynebacterium casei]|uniref:serine/threonine-protein kinase n=1 Tax=Corynebacterium casei TaxID=160386 RepID=UPI003F9AC036
MNTADNQELLQSLIGEDYVLQWIIGHGGMSTVWLADDTVNEREVALKVLRPEFSNNEEFLSRFRNEADAAENIDSDNVVKTYDYREVEDPSGYRFCFIVMEYVRGESLADFLAREKALPETLALDVLEQTAHGLSIIHRMDLVHRDIKPGNLLITQNGQVKITDFGIAKAAAAVPLTRTGMVVGTAQYVSPEQAQGKDVTEASDVYSLGVVGYEMLAGERPFSGDSSVSVALAHISQAPAPLSTNVSAPVRELIGIALRKDPNTRYADGNELALAVSAVRLGKRPPQPKAMPDNLIAPEPSPTAATAMLGEATNPTTIHPAVSAHPGTDPDAPAVTGAGAAAGGAAGVATQQRARAQAPAKKSSAGKSFGIGVGIAALAVALVGGGFYAATMFSGEDVDTEPTTEPEPSIVTEYVTTENEATETVVEPTPTEEEPEPEETTTNTPSPSRTATEGSPTPTNTSPGNTDTPTEGNGGGDGSDDGSGSGSNDGTGGESGEPTDTTGGDTGGNTGTEPGEDIIGDILDSLEGGANG